MYVHYGVHGTACVSGPRAAKSSGSGTIRRAITTVPVRRQSCGTHDLLILTFDGFDLQYLGRAQQTTGETVWMTRKFNYGTDNADVMKAYDA